VKRDLNNAFRRFWLTGSILALLALAVGLVLEIGVWQRTVAGAALVSLLISFGLAMRTNRARTLRRMQAAGEWLLNGYIIGGWAIAGLVALYTGTIVWGIAVGDALPTATVFRLLPATYRVWDAALFLAHGTLAIAALAALFSWLAVIPGLNTEGQRRCQARIARFWRVAGFPTLVLVLLFLLSGGGWSGRFSPFEMHYLSLGGLVPYSDAHDYYAAPFEAIYSGHWNDIAGRRPMAAATRSLVVALGGYSYSGALIVQAIIIGLAIGVCVGSLARSYGLWVALGFTGLAIGLARPFLITMMTEPLALVAALLALAFFVEALRLRSPAHALLGFSLLCVGLWIRMGSMFTIPIVAAGIPLLFADTMRGRLKLLAGAVAILVGIFGINFVLAEMFASAGSIGGNFAYTICGLARGTDWLECSRTFSAQLSELGAEHARQVLLWDEALRAIRAHPSIFVGRLWDGIAAYVTSIPRFFLVQYVPLFGPQRETVRWVVLALIPGWIFLMTRRERSCDILFFLIVFGSVVLSAAFVFFDDGGRVLTGTHVFIALMLVLGLSTPIARRADSQVPAISARTATVAVVASILAIAFAPVVSRAVAWSPPYAISGRGDIHFVPPIPTLTGFLVIPDGAPRPPNVPAMHASVFSEIIRFTKIENDGYLRHGQFLTDALTRVPFALVTAPRINGVNQTNLYLAPPQVLTESGVRALRLEIEGQPSDRPAWHRVHVIRRATPVE
jgi:hypothetical protein